MIQIYTFGQDKQKQNVKANINSGVCNILQAIRCNQFFQQTDPLYYYMVNKQTYELNVFIDDGKFNQTWIKIFKDMKVSKAIDFRVNKNNDPLILKHILSVSFTNLKLLDISQNNIDSLEALQFIDFPNVKELRMQSNKITEIKSIRKILLQNDQLEYVDLSQNFITSLSPICQINSLNLCKVVVNWVNSQHPKKSIYDDVHCDNSITELIFLPFIYRNAGRNSSQQILSQSSISLSKKNKMRKFPTDKILKSARPNIRIQSHKKIFSQRLKLIKSKLQQTIDGHKNSSVNSCLMRLYI